jgi:hypothetical protein
MRALRSIFSSSSALRAVPRTRRGIWPHRATQEGVAQPVRTTAEVEGARLACWTCVLDHKGYDLSNNSRAPFFKKQGGACSEADYMRAAADSGDYRQRSQAWRERAQAPRAMQAIMVDQFCQYWLFTPLYNFVYELAQAQAAWVAKRGYAVMWDALCNMC